ncbi:sensor histidine kinase [Dinghuibacter silviterrae]|uniref:Histidine kinase n=1 Tax=Dinghuibacter silviterrae TaxID=1539049 RepID=A0A4R8DKG3_9BACT|nr:histidine kinase [Dinghuibacter silviterrae]TDW97500.1 histidine kinase [Dinghuibacter silviterrae]
MILYHGLLLILGLVIALQFVIIMIQHQRMKQALMDHHSGKQDLVDKVRSLELETMKARLNPHLFKNALNAIQSHAYQTYYALDKLSNVLDFILYESERPFVTLKEEVEFALSLIEINRLKVSPLFDLQVKNRIDTASPLYTREWIAPLISIDLIENAFKHADLQREGAFIAILFELKGDRFTLTVSNKVSAGEPLKKEKSGVGRATLQTRLAALYPGRHHLEQFMQEEVYTAKLDLQL